MKRTGIVVVATLAVMLIASPALATPALASAGAPTASASSTTAVTARATAGHTLSVKPKKKYRKKFAMRFRPYHHRTVEAR